MLAITYRGGILALLFVVLFGGAISAQAPPAQPGQWLDRPPGGADGTPSCPAAEQWLLVYWGGAEQAFIATAANACPNANLYWSNRGGRWFGFARAAPAASDDWEILAGEAAFVHGAGGTATAPQSVEAAFTAALQVFNGIRATECTGDVPLARACVVLRSELTEVERGIAVFGVTTSAPAGPGGFIGILGRDAEGAWKHWFSTQNVVYQLLQLPGDMLVCNEGQGLSLRSEARTDAQESGRLEDLTRVRAEEFVLAVPALPNVPGIGWYRISAPETGWAPSRLLADARHGNCDLRNQQERR